MVILQLYNSLRLSTSAIYPDSGIFVSLATILPLKSIFHKAWCVLWMSAGLAILSACAAPTPLPPTDTPTPPPPTDTPTPTIVWFPATATSTPFPLPTLQPTPDQRPGIGALSFSDDFSDASAWLQSRTEQGSVAVVNNELTIAITEQNERSYLFSVRSQPVFSNFYLELTASPSLCRAKDEYGLLLRVSPGLDYYRFSLACDGNLRLDRVVNGQASSPQPWLLSGAVPPGAPSTVRLGVWAYGSEMRFFVNDEYQFTVRDPLLTSGGVGVFARSAGDMAVTVNFSALEVYEITGPPPAQPTATPSGAPDGAPTITTTP
ncbi:MAG: hypothetical protein JW726_07295 [Anaerolineales bacterium]|nr:hypothetical protein [Anaerolineales bacterium]